MPETPHAPTKRLGDHVKALRLKAGLTLRELAARSDVNHTWLLRLERGQYKEPAAQSLWRLARALEIEVAELYLEAGYNDGRGLPGFAPYLRAKYHLPEEAVAQLAAHFELINASYQPSKGGDRDEDRSTTQLDPDRQA